MQASEANQKDAIKIRFVDSNGKPIPYFASHRDYLAGEQDQLALQEYLRGCHWDELLPYQGIGGGIAPSRHDKAPYSIEELDLGWWKSSSEIDIQRLRVAGHTGPIDGYFYYIFPNGFIHFLSSSEAEKLKRDQVNVVVIPGDLGSGKWKDIGEFLFDASCFWRVDRGSQKNLVKRCNSLIEERKKEGDFTWAGNLVFVRELWLDAGTRAGMFGHKPPEQTQQEDQELPWRDATRSFGRGGSFVSGKPLKPYRAAKKVLEVNPLDSRALFWVKALPWINGFSPSKSNLTTNDYIRECQRVWREENGKLSVYHRFWYLKEFLETCDGMTYSERYWMKKKNIIHEKDIQWAIESIQAIIEKYPFLKHQTIYLNEWRQYMRDPNQISPLNTIDGQVKFQ